MSVKDPKGFATRRITAQHFRRFFAEWMTELAAGTADIWNKVEQRLAPNPRVTESKGDILQSVTPSPTATQQPVQQQQARAKLDEKE